MISSVYQGVKIYKPCHGNKRITIFFNTKILCTFYFTKKTIP